MKRAVKICLGCCTVSAIAAGSFWLGTMRRGNLTEDVASVNIKGDVSIGRMPKEVFSRQTRQAESRAAEGKEDVRNKKIFSSGGNGLQTEADVQSSIQEIMEALDKGRVNEDEAARRIRQLRGKDDTLLLQCLSNMTSSSDAMERSRAYAMIGVAYGSDGKPLVIDLDADPDSEEVRLDAQRTHKLVDMIGRGLSDGDEEIREAAFETFRMLDGDASAILARQILGGEDTGLKLKLMSATANTVTGHAIAISLDALGNVDEAVRAAAHKNISEVTGQSFESQEAARDWWEANSTDFLTKVYSGVDMNATTMEEFSHEEQLMTDDNQKKE